jgi:hypothetical protein
MRYLQSFSYYPTSDTIESVLLRSSRLGAYKITPYVEDRTCPPAQHLIDACLCHTRVLHDVPQAMDTDLEKERERAVSMREEAILWG